MLLRWHNPWPTKTAEAWNSLQPKWGKFCHASKAISVSVSDVFQSKEASEFVHMRRTSVKHQKAKVKLWILTAVVQQWKRIDTWKQHFQTDSTNSFIFVSTQVHSPQISTFFLSKALIKLIAVVKAKLFFDFTRFLICFFTQSYALFLDHYQKHRHYVRECKLKHVE